MTDAHHLDPFRRLVYFVTERETVRLNKEALRLPRVQWTQDEILQTYRFCCVRREHDRVTRWIADNWRTPHADDPDLWFAMVAARFINWPPTLVHLGYPVPWEPERFRAVMSGRSGKSYTGAYMIRSDKEWAGRPKHDYLATAQFSPLWEKRETLRPRPDDTLNSYHMTLGQFYGMGSFMAGQVVADMRYVEPLRSARDWMTFATSGPGSRRGLNRLLERGVDDPWTEDEWRGSLARLQTRLNDALRWDEPLHGQDAQNCLCEFDKWERVRLGEGRPRARYTPHEY